MIWQALDKLLLDSFGDKDYLILKEWPFQTLLFKLPSIYYGNPKKKMETLPPISQGAVRQLNLKTINIKVPLKKQKEWGRDNSFLIQKHIQ